MKTPTLRLVLAAMLTVSLTLLSQPLAHATPPTTKSTKVHGPAKPRQLKQGQQVTSSTSIAPMAMSASASQAFALVNSYRTAYGAPKLTENATYTQAATNHANYCNLNGDTLPGCTTPYNMADPNNPQWENPSKPGWTQLGSDYAMYMLMVPTGNPVDAVNAIMNDPGFRDSYLLDLTAVTMGIASVGTWTMVITDWSGYTTSYPRTWPAGQLGPQFRSFGLDSGTVAEYTSGCPGTTQYGYPLSTQWDFSRYTGPATSSSGTLYMDSSKQAVCMVTNKSMLLNGQAVMVPLAPLRNGMIYTGTMTGTFPTASGPATVTKSYMFTTWAPATNAAGDQSGDGVADFMGINGANLYFYKMRTDGRVGASMLISTRFSNITWMSHIPDVNKDARDDMLVRDSRGDIYIWYGNGMGSFSQGPRVGVAWNSMNKIIAVGDMTGDGTPEMIARDTNGYLWRFTVFSDRISNKVLIGSSFNSQKDIVPIGKYNADNRYDIVTVDSSGNLWEWNTTTAGALGTKTKIGSGWGSYTWLFAPGDVNKDGRWDLMARDSAGNLYTWFNNGTGLTRVTAGGAWKAFRVLG